MKQKTLNRLKIITSNTVRQIIISVFSVAIPFMVIHNSSKEIWGTFVSVLLYTLMALQIINWGNKEYLLREFSKNPSKIAITFSENLSTRFPLVILSVVVGLFLFPFSYCFWLTIWVFGRFLIHSIEALLVYEKKFIKSVFVELFSFLVFGILFCFFQSVIDTYLIVVLYSIYQFLKGLLYFYILKKNFLLRKFFFKVDYFKVSFPFFLLSILGFLASKIDVYLVHYFLSKKVLSDYQIINSLLVFIMSFAVFVYGPFTKNIYRSKENVITKSKRIMLFLCLFIIPISILFIYLVLYYYLQLKFSFLFYFLCFLYVFPSYIYGVDIVNLFKQNQQFKVVKYSFLIVLLNLLLSSLFLHLNYEIIGVLAGSAISQLVGLILFSKNLNKYAF